MTDEKLAELRPEEANSTLEVKQQIDRLIRPPEGRRYNKQRDEIILPAEHDLGPKMKALRSHRQRKFVLALARYGDISYADAARLAGYEGQNHRMVGYQLARRRDILEALQEEVGRRLHAGISLAADILLNIIQDSETKPADKLKALELLDRWCGSPSKKAEAQSDQKDVSEKEMVQRLVNLAAELKVDPTQLLGSNLPIEAEPTATNVDE